MFDRRSSDSCVPSYENIMDSEKEDREHIREKRAQDILNGFQVYPFFLVCTLLASYCT